MAIPLAFFHGLKEDQQMQTGININTVTMMRCIKWVMKKYGMDIEVRRANVTGILMSLRLMKYDENGQSIDTGLDINVTDNRIEKGLWELEYETMQRANLEAMNGLDIVLEALRKSKLTLPSHDDLRNEVIMKGHTIRISYIGVDPTYGDDLYVGSLLLNGKMVSVTDPQRRLRNVLDNLENTVYAEKREHFRKSLGEFMLKLSDTPGAVG